MTPAEPPEIHPRCRAPAAARLRVHGELQTHPDGVLLPDLADEVVSVHLDPTGARPPAFGMFAFHRSSDHLRDGAVAPAIEDVPPITLDRLFARWPSAVSR